MLAAVPGFETAAVLDSLSDGPTNASFMVEKDGEAFVLRVDKPAAARLGLDRENEKQVLSAPAAAGLVPEPVFFDAARGVFLRPFLPGRSWTEADLGRDENLARLAKLLRRLHALPPVGKTFDPLAAAERYAAGLATEQAQDILLQAEALWSESSPISSAALCHNDLLCQNIIEADDGQLMLIDWEYAAVGDPFFDLAIVVQHHGLEESRAGRFLESYLGRPATTAEQNQLSQQCRFYQHLLDLWNLAVS
jgi:thiamine kinase